MNNQYFMGGVQRGLSGIGAGTGLYGLAGMARQQQSPTGGSNTTDSQQQTASLPQQSSAGLTGTPVSMPSSGGAFPFWEIPTDQLFPQYPTYQPSYAQQPVMETAIEQPGRPQNWGINQYSYQEPDQWGGRTGPTVIDEERRRQLEEEFRRDAERSGLG